MRLIATLMALGATLAVPGCTTGSAAPGSDGAPALGFACPTPSTATITSPYALTGQDLLRNSDYITLMINHGSLENLENILESVRRTYNAGVASPYDVERLEDAIVFRRANTCPDVPFYVPYVTDTPIDGPAL